MRVGADAHPGALAIGRICTHAGNPDAGTTAIPAHPLSMAAQSYRFGAFRLDVGARALWHGSDAVTLPPKAFDCIVYLLQNRERAVGRDELIAAVWGKADVTDGVLGQTILLARRALDDTGREQHVIRTVLRFGYHWVAPVEPLMPADPVYPPAVTEEPAAAAASAPGPLPAPLVAVAAGGRAGDLAIEAAGPAAAAPRRRRTAPRGLLAAALLLACIGLAAAVWSWRRMPDPPVATAAASTGSATLVLPVAVFGDAQAAWVRLGVMDLVAARLHASGQAMVPSDNVVALARAYERAAVDAGELRDLARAAGAERVIDARAEALEDGWRVSLRTLLGPGPPLAVSADAPDVLAAARLATDRLANALGLPVASATGAAAADPLVQKVEAALLEDRVDAALALLDSATPRQQALPSLRLQRGRAEFMAGRLDSAEALFRALADAVPADADRVVHGKTLNALGAIALQRQLPDVALPELDRAIGLLTRTEAVGALGKAYGNRAAAHAMKREYPAELADLAQARLALATAGDMLGLAVIDSNVGASTMNRDRFAEAAPILASSAARFAAFHAWAAELNARSNQVQVQLALLDPAAALESADRIAWLVERVSDPARRRASSLMRTAALFANGHVAEGDALLDSIRAQATDDPEAMARAQAIAARNALARGDAALAEREATASLRVPPAPQDPRETGSTWLTLVRAQLAQGHVAAAEASLRGAQAWAAADGSATAALQVALAGAEYRAASGDAAGARSAFEAAQSLAEEGRVPVDLAAVAQSYVDWLMQQRDFRRASTMAEGVAAWAPRDYPTALLQLRVFHALRDPAAWQAALARTQALAGERAIPAELAHGP
jgi:DNA-binding winged helix-turn-helix (wHTH) protein